MSREGFGSRGSASPSSPLVLLAVIGVVTALAGLAWSGSLRAAPGKIELAVSLRTLQRLSLDWGRDPADTVESFVRAGVTALVVEERMVEDLGLLGELNIVRHPPQSTSALTPEEERLVSRISGLAEWRSSAPGTPVTLLVTRDSGLAQWAFQRATARLGTGRVTRLGVSGEDGAPGENGLQAVAVLGNLPPYMRLGFYPPDLALAERLGLRLVIQLQNPREQPGFPLAAALTALDGQMTRVTAVTFEGGEVWGYGRPGGPSEAGGVLAAAGLPFAVDANKLPAGIRELGAAADWRGLGIQTVWSTGRPELFVEGVVERQAPLLVIQSALLKRYPEDPAWLSQATAAVTALRDGLVSRGVEMARPAGVDPRRPPVWVLALVGSGILAAAALALGEVVSLAASRRKQRVSLRAVIGLVVAAGGLLVLILSSSYAVVTIQALALLGALTFPVLGLRAVFRFWATEAGSAAGALPPRGPLWAALRETARVAIVAAAGGLLIRALGTGPEFALKVVVFRGTQLALVAGPVAAVALLWLADTSRDEATRLTRWRALRQGGAGLLNSRISLGALAAMALVGGLALLYVNRASTTPLLPVSDLEFSLRRGLMDLFGIRPRTKEFLIGFPAVLVGSWLAAGRSRYPVALRYGLAALAGIGVSSVLNTFSHFHIPAGVSLVRTAYGLGLGVLIGAAVAGGIHLWRRTGARRGSGTGRGGGG